MQTACETMTEATETIQRLKSQIERLEEELINAKGKWAALVADVVLHEDRGERIRLLISERDSARLQADKKISLREEFRELLQTDDIEQGVIVVRGLQERIKRLEMIISRARNVFFRDGSCGRAASGMLEILGEVRKP
jgi:chromosome segregation ATPase